MRTIETVQVLAAFMLALLAAAMSGNAQARQEISDFIARFSSPCRLIWERIQRFLRSEDCDALCLCERS
jgi:hypothetical protein